MEHNFDEHHLKHLWDSSAAKMAAVEKGLLTKKKKATAASVWANYDLFSTSSPMFVLTDIAKNNPKI